MSRFLWFTVYMCVKRPVSAQQHAVTDEQWSEFRNYFSWYIVGRRNHDRNFPPTVTANHASW